MPQIDEQIRARVDEFVAELSDLIRVAAFQAVEEALGGSVSGAGARRAPGPVRRKKKAARRAAGRGAAGGAATGSEDVLAHIRGNPGLRLEEMSTSMGVASASLRPAVQQLLAEGRVRTEGRARGTRYFAGGGGRGAKKKRGGARRKAGRKKGGRRRKKSARRTKASAAAAAE